MKKWTGSGKFFQDVVQGTPAKKAPVVKIPEVRVRPPSLAYVPQNRREFCNCEYDLGEIARAADTESMINISISKHVTLCLKEGWEIVSKDEQALRYVKRRLFEFELATLRSFASLLRDTFWNTVAYSNAFLVFKRDIDLSTGNMIRRHGRDLEPIAGIFHADPSSMKIRRSKNGVVKKYEQEISGMRYVQHATKQFQPEDVLHVKYNQKTGFAWGTPFLIPVLDDVRMLRNMEELAGLVVHRGAFPFYHYQVGTDVLPAFEDENGGSSEITRADDAIQNKEPAGIFVTSHRHNITAVDGNAAVKDITKYLEYFEQRIISGLNLSGVDLGRGGTANRGTATQMSKSLQNRCKDYQKTVCEALQILFDDLLQEGGFDLSEDTRVTLQFPEIDVETQMIVHNHLMALYQGHAITWSEMRRKMSMDPVVEESDMFFEKVQKQQIQEEAKVALQAAEAKAASSNRPTNQSGKKSARTQTANDSEEVDPVVYLIEDRLDTFVSLLRDEFKQGVPQDNINLHHKLTPVIVDIFGDVLPVDASTEINVALSILSGMKDYEVNARLGSVYSRLRNVLVNACQRQ